jgi:hypothetical protein
MGGVRHQVFSFISGFSADVIQEVMAGPHEVLRYDGCQQIPCCFTSEQLPVLKPPFRQSLLSWSLGHYVCACISRYKIGILTWCAQYIPVYIILSSATSPRSLRINVEIICSRVLSRQSFGNCDTGDATQCVKDVWRFGTFS